MLSDALLTIHAIPALSSAQDLDTLSPANADALWSLGLPHGPALDSIRNLWIFEDVPKKSGMEDVTCIVCAMAPAFRYIIRVPFSSTVPLDVNHASFGKPTVTSATDVNLYRGVVKIYETGLISFVGDLDNWIEVTHNVAKLQCFNSFDFPFMGGTEDADADVTLTTFDQGSGRVCVLNRFTNEIEAVDFA